MLHPEQLGHAVLSLLMITPVFQAGNSDVVQSTLDLTDPYVIWVSTVYLPSGISNTLLHHLSAARLPTCQAHQEAAESIVNTAWLAEISTTV